MYGIAPGQNYVYEDLCSVTPKPKGAVWYYPALLATSGENYVR